MKHDGIRKNLLRFTDRAMDLLPPMREPAILDIGCGSGIPTLRLAERTEGKIVGLDSDEDALNTLRARIEELGLSGRVETRAGSLEDIPYADGSFDLIWSEGAIAVLGFRESLRSWRRLLKSGGCMVLHDEAGDVDGKLRMVPEEGFVLLGYFEVPEQVWWDDFYALADVEMDLAEEISLFQARPERFRSAFFVLRLADVEKETIGDTTLR